MCIYFDLAGIVYEQQSAFSMAEEKRHTSSQTELYYTATHLETAK